ncbi:type II secretion system major pseudopilin GspG [Pseudoroseicyclus tamaricis]|uniref:Type II secretion system core protein G n=1 Tax=Pseudoroseicyclus tamaricis TaxID=2705421 RepID=A0A6B2JYW9_9RHOB|nr:type II secretion system major pseudopilin GspG [Pseudoroseicyclus tamaricis]
MTDRRDARLGITLLEVLIVLAILAMVTTLAAPRLIETFGRARSHVAEVQLANISAAIQIYYLDTGQFPTQAEGLSALVLRPQGVEGWSGPYLDAESVADPWGRKWIFRQPGQDGSFELISYGRDGQPGGANEDADISS